MPLKVIPLSDRRFSVKDDVYIEWRLPVNIFRTGRSINALKRKIKLEQRTQELNKKIFYRQKSENLYIKNNQIYNELLAMSNGNFLYFQCNLTNF